MLPKFSKPFRFNLLIYDKHKVTSKFEQAISPEIRIIFWGNHNWMCENHVSLGSSEQTNFGLHWQKSLVSEYATFKIFESRNVKVIPVIYHKICKLLRNYNLHRQARVCKSFLF